MDRTRELMAQGILNMLMVAWYGERASRPTREVSPQANRYYAKEEYPDWLAEELKTLDIIPATNLAVEVATRVDEAYSYAFRNGNGAGWYGCYSKLLDFALIANATFGKILTDAQIAYWVFAAVEKDKRYKFAARKASEFEERIQKELMMARDEEVKVAEFRALIRRQRRYADFWHDVAEKMLAEEGAGEKSKKDK